MRFPAKSTARFPAKKRWHSLPPSGCLGTSLPLPQSLYGRTEVRTDGHVTITSEPKFLGLIVYQISLAMELRSGFASRLRYYVTTKISRIHTVGGTSTSFGQFSYLCPKKPEGARRSSDLYCPIRKNYELAQKNERECFQVSNMAPLARRNLQAISLLPVMLWQYEGEVWLWEILQFMH